MSNLVPREPDNDMVICPNCTCRFVAIPVNVQERLAERELDWLNQQEQIKDQQARLAEAERDAVRDAERYRWLRAHGMHKQPQACNFGGENLDEVVDAFLSATDSAPAVTPFCGPFPKHSDDERTLRELLAFAHARPGELYGDDGELQLGGYPHPIDFRRDTVAEIRRKIEARGMAKIVAAQTAPAAPTCNGKCHGAFADVDCPEHGIAQYLNRPAPRTISHEPDCPWNDPEDQRCLCGARDSAPAAPTNPHQDLCDWANGLTDDSPFSAPPDVLRTPDDPLSPNYDPTYTTETADAGHSVQCSECGATHVLRYTDRAKTAVSLAGFDGWSVDSSGVRCPKCSTASTVDGVKP